MELLVDEDIRPFESYSNRVGGVDGYSELIRQSSIVRDQRSVDGWLEIRSVDGWNYEKYRSVDGWAKDAALMAGRKNSQH